LWQGAAAKVVGQLGLASSVEPLLGIMVDPEKQLVSTVALLPLLPLIRLKRAILERCKALINEPGHTELAALILGTQGRVDAAPVLLEAWRLSGDPGE
jgi:hypothetical protein